MSASTPREEEGATAAANGATAAHALGASADATSAPPSAQPSAPPSQLPSTCPSAQPPRRAASHGSTPSPASVIPHGALDLLSGLVGDVWSHEGAEAHTDPFGREHAQSCHGEREGHKEAFEHDSFEGLAALGGASGLQTAATAA